MSRERLPWFKCYPSNLLAAIAGLDPDESLLYVVILLRIYESGGPAKDSVKTLCRRAGLPEKRGILAFESLQRSGKILMTETGEIDSETTHKHLNERADVLNNAKNAGKTSAEKRAEKNKQYQENDATGVEISVNETSTTKTKIEIKKERKKEKESPNGDSQKPGFELLPVDPEPKQKPASPKKLRLRTRIDPETQPTEKDRQEANNAGMSADEFRFEWRRFRDHHLKEGSLMADWPAAWRYWISNWIKFSARDRPSGGRRSAPRDGCSELLDEIAQERARRNGQSPDDDGQQPSKPSKFARDFDREETFELS